MDEIAVAMEHNETLPVTRKECKEAHAANRALTLWVAGITVTICMSVAGWAGSLATSAAATSTKLAEHEVAQREMDVTQETRRQEDKRDIMARFDRFDVKIDQIEAKIDHRLSLPSKAP